MSESNGAVKTKPKNRLEAVETAAPTETSTVVFAPAKIYGRRVAIIGKAPSSKDLAPYDDPSWEIWGVGDLGMQVKRISRTFELHDIADGFTRWNPQYVEWLKKDKGHPMYVFDKHKDLTKCEEYPRAEIMAEFGQRCVDNEGTGIHYFTNTISWMIALAVHEQVQEIGLWGVDMAQHGIGLQSEYAAQRPSCELWLGIAIGRGIKVQIHQNSDLLKAAYQYGYDPAPHSMRIKHKARAGDLQQGKAKAQQKAQEYENEIIRLEEHVEYTKSRLLGILGSTKEDEEAREKLIDKIGQLKAAIAIFTAKKDEQIQRQLVHMGAQDDMQYWHQHHFG